ncbi:MAG: TonB-dependent siderophore receptor [Deltaproteobacteria bacterium]|nr:MAG: TonB-dependent siderophore receptor [Deltaproteobacteria bacterium]
MKKTYTKLVITLGVTLLLIQPCTVFSTTQEKGESFTKLEEITVTANKVEENLQDVPQSVSVIGEIELEEKGMRKIPDLIREIPNMHIMEGNYLGRSVNFRGLNASVFTNSNPVVIYIDGVPLYDKHIFDASLVDVERVEVLRGPQGTLYGKDAIGGVINIVTKTPENDWHGKVEGEYGTNNYMEMSLDASGSLIEDKFFLGINGQYQQDDGWTENTYPGMDSDANSSDGRRIGAYLLYTPTERLSARLTVSNIHNKSYWEDGYAQPLGTPLSAFHRDDAEVVSFDVPDWNEKDNLSQSIFVNYDFDSMTLSSITTHQTSKQEVHYDADFMANTVYDGCAMFTDSEVDTYTQELRLASNKDSGIRWVGGIYLEHDDREMAPYGQSFPMYDPASYAYLGTYEMYSASETNANTYAAFGQVMIPFMDDRFELTLGGRYQHVEKEMDLDMFFKPAGSVAPPQFSMSPDKDWNIFLPKAALGYSINDNWNMYASYSQGYMPGGFNFFPSTPDDRGNTFKPQESRNYELGLKGEINRFWINMALFYMDIKDIHVYRSENDMYYTENADSAHSLGIEAEAGWHITDTLDLTASAGVINAEYDDYDAGNGVSYDGQDIEITPSYTANLSASYVHPNGFYSRMDVKMVGDVYFFNAAGQSFVKESPYATVDAKIGYLMNNWDFYVYGKNLTDEEYIIGYVSMASTLVNYGKPRTIGVGVRYRF